MEISIRKTTPEDLENILKVYERAVRFMAETGNPNQWVNGYPGRELLQEDILKGVSYVAEDDEIEAVFTFIIGPDPTYQEIEQGSWLNEEEYGTIHRLASSGKKKGMAELCFHWCAKKCGNLRADTHEDNKMMQYLLQKNGFARCGMIHLLNGEPRIAYQKRPV